MGKARNRKIAQRAMRWTTSKIEDTLKEESQKRVLLVKKTFELALELRRQAYQKKQAARRLALRPGIRKGEQSET